MVAVYLAATSTFADDSQTTPPSTKPAAPKEMPNLSKPIYSPDKVSMDKQPGAPIAPATSSTQNIDLQLPRPEDLPAATEESKISTDNPMGQLDPDGVPLSVTQGQPQKPSQAMVDAYLKQRAAAEQNKDWLLRSYEDQVKARQARDKDQTQNFYNELTSNRELARLAGLPVTDDTPGTAFRTDDTSQDDKAAALRKEADDADATKANKLPKPMISWNSSTAATNITAPLPFAIPSSFDKIDPQTQSQPQTSKVDDSDLDTPGAISERKDSDSLTDSSTSDLTLDMLPGETADQARAHQDYNSRAELSLPMDATLLHKEQAAFSQGPQLPRPAGENPTTTITPLGPPAPTPGTSTAATDPNAPVPVSQVPQPSSRPPIARPFDLLNR